MNTLATAIALNETVVPFGDDKVKYITVAGFKDGKAIVTAAAGAPLEIPQSELPSDAGAGTLLYLNVECNTIEAYRINPPAAKQKRTAGQGCSQGYVAGPSN